MDGMLCKITTIDGQTTQSMMTEENWQRVQSTNMVLLKTYSSFHSLIINVAGQSESSTFPGMWRVLSTLSDGTTRGVLNGDTIFTALMSPNDESQQGYIRYIN